MAKTNIRLNNQTVIKTFFQYLIPTLVGMMLMSVNIVIDGIFVGNGVSSTALASVNIAVPIFSVILSIALLIGVGGGALYSMALGEENVPRAREIFTMSFVFLSIVTVVITIISYLFIEQLALLFGANEDTLPYAVEYMRILIIFSLFIAIETCLSIFVRNDGNPQLAMVGLIVTAVLNIALNYWMIFILKMGVTGAALATVIATVVGLLVLVTHFFRKRSLLKFVRFEWQRSDLLRNNAIGFPSFLSEAGMGFFVIGYNVAMGFYIGTVGVAAFSVINYLHIFMFLAFIGIGSTIQPMISFYYGAEAFDKIKETVKLAEKTALVLGVIFISIGFIGANYLVSIFGIQSEAISTLAAQGIKLFFIGYLFMGINFVYMTYFQSIGYVKPSLLITIFRGFVLLIFTLIILPPFMGAAGIWLAVPISEAIVMIVLILYARDGIMLKQLSVYGGNESEDV